MRKPPNQIFDWVDCVSIKKYNVFKNKGKQNKCCMFVLVYQKLLHNSAFSFVTKKNCRSPSKASKCQQGPNPPLINILFDPFSRKSSLAGNAAASRGGHAYQQNVQRTSKEGHTSGLKSQLGLNLTTLYFSFRLDYIFSSPSRALASKVEPKLRPSCEFFIIEPSTAYFLKPTFEVVGQ